MGVTWIIQNIFGDETAKLCEHIKSYKIINSDSAYLEDGVTGFNYIVRGSIDFVDQFHRMYFDCTFPCLDSFSCSNYYMHFGNRLINHDSIFMPWGLLKANKEMIHDIFPGDSLFIRPDSGRKLFTGTTLTKKWWDKELDIIKGLPYCRVTNQDMVLISSVKKIISEYRVLMYNNEILGYSHYEGEIQKNTNFTKALVNFWGETNNYIPDTLYTMDLAWTEDSVKLLELNSFYSSGLYDMDFKHIVKRIEKIYGQT